MRRDFDLVREILFRVEELRPGTHVRAEELHVSNTAMAIVVEHARLLYENGLVEGKFKPLANAPYPLLILTGLTWSGHEYIDSITQDSVWEKTKRVVVSNGGSLTFAIVQQVATSVITGLAH